MTFASIRKYILNNFRDAKLRNKLIFSYSVFVIIPILFLGLGAFSLSKSYLIESEKESLTQSMTQLNNSLDYFFEIYMDKTNMLFFNTELQAILSTEVDNIGSVVDAEKRINDICSIINYDLKYPEMKNSYYYGGNIDYEIYSTNKTLTEYSGRVLPIESIISEKEIKALYNSERVFSWQSGYSTDGKSEVFLNRRLADFETSKITGVLRILIPVSRIEAVIGNNVHNRQEYVYYVDENFNKITAVGMDSYSADTYFASIKKLNPTEATAEVTIQNQKFILGCMKSDSTGWRLIYLIPLSEITSKSGTIIGITVITTLAAFFMCIVIAVVISSYVTKRIKILLTKTDMIGENNLSVSVKIKGKDEIGQLDKNFNKMVERINNLIEKEYKTEIFISKTRFELLQAQINPHLLYNTLSVISSVSKNSGQKEIFAVTDNLINFYKGILNSGKLITRLEDEIEMVKRYVEIVRYVYALDIEVIYDIDEEILQNYTIKLLLQPIVENAIVHGIKPKKEGMLVISGGFIDEGIQLVVSDDGIGIDDYVMEYFNTIFDNNSEDKGYGLGNIMKRIRLYFGSSFGVEVNSLKGEGTTIIIKIPRLTKQQLEEVV